MSEHGYATYELRGDVALIGLNRPDKRNALSPELMAGLKDAVDRAGRESKCVVLYGHGKNFSSGLDLAWAAEAWKEGGRSKLPFADPRDSCFEALARGRVPVVAALHGAVLGGGFEIAASAHIRVADETAFFGLPEGSRGIFLGGGGSVRIARLIGAARMQDMMLTGRTLGASAAEQCGVVQYVVPEGRVLEDALELAGKICANAELSNFAIVNSLPRLQDMSYDDGLFFERMVAEFTRSSESIDRLHDFLDRRAPRMRLPE